MIFEYKIHFKSPLKSDVIIFHSTNSDIVRKVVDPKHSVYVFSPNPKEFFVGIKILKILFKKLFSHKISENIKHRNGIIYGLFRYVYYVYIESYLSVINPNYALTFIDNCQIFGWLSKNCRQFPFISIQNGCRLSYASTNESNYFSQHLFCFGKHEENLFPKINYNVENFYPCGSLITSLNYNRFQEDIYDILIISTWRGNIGFQEDVQDTMKSMKTMDHLLSRYLSERKLRVAVILRSEENSKDWYMPEIGMNERDYYYQSYSHLIEIIPNNFNIRPIYPMIQKSRMIVSTLSSALLEGFGMGKKALYYNFCESNKYHKDFDSLIVSNNTNFEQFSKEIDDILEMSANQYKNQYKTLQKYYMSFPDDYSTKDYIRKKIGSIVLKNRS